MFAKLITGKNHIKNSEVCQDNWRAYYSINNKLTILVLSDGAGSSKKSNIGYQLGAQVGETAILSNVGRFLGYNIKPLALEGSAGTFLLKKDISKEKVRFKRGGAAKIFDGVKNFGLTINYEFLNKYGKKVFQKNI